MIPKVIHYCWFGGHPLPKSALRCIETWKKFFPGWEIKEWNESNFDITSIAYTLQAYGAKKYAFVSDYARFWIIYHYGGVYFDTDVEVIKPFDEILSQGPFMGREIGSRLRNICFKNGWPKGLNIATLAENDWGINPGLGIGAPAGMPIYKEILDEYVGRSFIKEDGSLNTQTIVSYTSETLLRHGLGDVPSTDPAVVSGIWIYPADYFCPMNHTRGNILNITGNTVSIHRYDSSWNEHNALHYVLHIFKNFLMRKFGPKFVEKFICVRK